MVLASFHCDLSKQPGHGPRLEARLSNGESRVVGAEDVFSEGRCSDMNASSLVRGKGVGTFCQPVHSSYIIERRCGDIHTVADASLHRVP